MEFNYFKDEYPSLEQINERRERLTAEIEGYKEYGRRLDLRIKFYESDVGKILRDMENADPKTIFHYCMAHKCHMKKKNNELRLNLAVLKLKTVEQEGIILELATRKGDMKARIEEMKTEPTTQDVRRAVELHDRLWQDLVTAMDVRYKMTFEESELSKKAVKTIRSNFEQELRLQCSLLEQMKNHPEQNEKTAELITEQEKSVYGMLCERNEVSPIIKGKYKIMIEELGRKYSGMELTDDAAPVTVSKCKGRSSHKKEETQNDKKKRPTR